MWKCKQLKYLRNKVRGFERKLYKDGIKRFENHLDVIQYNVRKGKEYFAIILFQ